MLVQSGVKNIGLSVIFLLLLPSFVFAVTARIRWKPNIEGDLAGYRVYYGTSPSTYNHVIGAGITPSVDVISLRQGRTYYFAVTALDLRGNESLFSQEIRVPIPADTTRTDTETGSGTDNGSGAGSNSGDGNGSTSLFDTMVELIREALGLGPEDPLYTMPDSGNNGSGSTSTPPSAIDLEGLSGNQKNDAVGLEEYYPVHDVILQVNMPLDLTAIYPDRGYCFYPVEETCPAIEGDMLTPEKPGRYLYVVFDEVGTVLHVLRLSVAEELYQLKAYDPASSLMLNDLATGIAVDIPTNAAAHTVPIAIGWGGEELFPAFSQLAQGDNALSFDLLPYGLMLREPALVYMPINAEDVYVMQYDEKTGEWVEVQDVQQVSEGLMSFSTKALGRFMVVSLAAQPEDGGGNSYEGSETGCFVEGARASQGIDGLTALLAAIASIFSLAVVRFNK